jgi:Ca2+/Na+ antiporter
MRYFVLLDFQYIVLAVGLGIAATILLYVAFGVPVISRKREKEPEHYTDGLRIEKNPIPPILVFLYAAILIWAMAYMLVEGINGAPF